MLKLGVAVILSLSTLIYAQWIATGILQLMAEMVSSLFIGITCLLLLKKVKIQCGITAFLGEISLEIYVFHGMFIEIFGGDKTTWGSAGL